MLEKVTFMNAGEIYEATCIFNDTEVTQKCRNLFFPAIYQTTKKPQFFKDTKPVEKNTRDEAVFETECVPISSKIRSDLKIYKNEIEQEENLYVQIDKYLGLIRFLTSEVDEIFKDIIPDSVATFSCSLNWIHEEMMGVIRRKPLFKSKSTVV